MAPRRRAAPAAAPAQHGRPRRSGRRQAPRAARDARRSAPPRRAAPARATPRRGRCAPPRPRAAAPRVRAACSTRCSAGRVWIVPGRRAARGHRVLQRRPAADEPRDRADGRPRPPAQARERPPAARRGPPRAQRAHPAGRRGAAAWCCPPRRRALPASRTRPSTPARRVAQRDRCRAGAGDTFTDRRCCAEPDADRARRPPTTTHHNRPTAADHDHAAGHPTATARRPNGLAVRLRRAQDRASLRRLPGPPRRRRGAGHLARHGQGRLARGARRPRSRSRTSTVPARRGTIFDRNGLELAVSEDAITVFAQPLPDRRPGRRRRAAGAAARPARGRPAASSSPTATPASSTCAARWTPRRAPGRAAQDRGHRHRGRAEADLPAGLAGLAGARHGRHRQQRPGRARVLAGGDAARRRTASAARQGRARRAGQPGRDRARRRRARTSS